MFPTFGQSGHDTTPYSSPPIGFSQSFPLHGVPGAQQASPYMPTDYGAETYTPHNKRQRLEEGTIYDETLADEKETGAGKQDPGSKRP